MRGIFAYALLTLVSGCTQVAVEPKPATTVEAVSQSDRDVQAASALLDSWSGDPEVLVRANVMLMQVLSSEPSNYRALKELARYHIMAGYINSRWARYGKQLYKVGNFRPGSLERAEATIRQALRANPSFAEGYVLLGHVYFQRTMLEEAAKSLAQAEALGTDDPWLQLNWADVHEARGEYPAAVVRMQRVLQRGSSNPKALTSAYDHLIENYKRIGEHDKAVALYGEQLERNPTNAWLHGNFSNYLQTLGRNDEAITQARQALEIMNYGMGRQSLAMALYGKWADMVAEANDARAETYFEEARSIRPRLNEVMAYGASVPHGGRLAKALVAKKGVSIDARADDGSTALLIATNRSDAQTVRFLLDLNANPNIPDQVGWTPLLSAADEGDVEIAEMLLAKGADVRATLGGADPAAMAQNNGHAELAALLRKRAAGKR